MSLVHAFIGLSLWLCVSVSVLPVLLCYYGFIPDSNKWNGMEMPLVGLLSFSSYQQSTTIDDEQIAKSKELKITFLRKWSLLMSPAGLAAVSGRAHRGELTGVCPSLSGVWILNPWRRSIGWRCRREAGTLRALPPGDGGWKLGPWSHWILPLHYMTLRKVARMMSFKNIIVKSSLPLISTILSYFHNVLALVSLRC